MGEPQWTPTPRELAHLELVTLGILEDSALQIEVPAETAPGDTLQLLDPEGLPLARLHISRRHEHGRGVSVTGVVEPLAQPEYGPFRRLHLPPGAVRAAHPQAVAVPVVDALTVDDARAVTEQARGRTPLLLVMAGPSAPGGLSAPGLVRATLAAAADIPGAVVVAVNTARDEDASRLHRVASAYADGVAHVAGRGELSPEVARVRDQDRPPRLRQGLVVFFTGLSGSGKSTLARALYDEIVERGERTVTSLDGDVVRHHLSKGLGFSREDRETNIARIGWVAAEISRHGGVAICSPIAPFDATRQLVRGMVEQAGGVFVLVHVATPLAECERRDRKGLYAKARAGLIPDFTGISSPYEEPADASITVDTTGRSVPDALADLTYYLASEGLVSRSS